MGTSGQESLGYSFNSEPNQVPLLFHIRYSLRLNSARVNALFPTCHNSLYTITQGSDSTSSIDYTNIKSEITTNGGVLILFYQDRSCFSNNPATYYNPTTTSVNHVVTIVG